MSLFDILKYQNTDITKRCNLLELPPAIIEAFWKQAYPYHFDDIGDIGVDFAETCMWLAGWSHDSPKIYKILFKDVLENYEPV